MQPGDIVRLTSSQDERWVLMGVVPNAVAIPHCTFHIVTEDEEDEDSYCGGGEWIAVCIDSPASRRPLGYTDFLSERNLEPADDPRYGSA